MKLSLLYSFVVVISFLSVFFPTNVSANDMTQAVTNELSVLSNFAARLTESEELHPLSVLTTNVLNTVTASFRSKELLKVDKENGIVPGKPRYSTLLLSVMLSTLCLGIVTLIFPILIFYMIIVGTGYEGPLYEKSDFADLPKKFQGGSKKSSKNRSGGASFRGEITASGINDNIPAVESLKEETQAESSSKEMSFASSVSLAASCLVTFVVGILIL